MPIRYSRMAIAAALALTFQPVFAASEEDAAIVVTATRFHSNKSDRPIAAQVITADDIRDSSATTVSEVLGKLGGVHTRINSTGVPDSPLDLRGFGMTGDQNTLVLLNGQRISENELVSARLSSIPIDSIERIEILRGTGAVLYGGGATGGTINIITRSPITEGLSGNISALTGSHNLRDFRGGLQVGSGNWGLSLNAQRYENDNYRENNRAKLNVVSGELRFGVQDGFIALNISADDQKSRLPGVRKVDPIANVDQLSTDPRGATTPNDYMNSRSELLSLQGEKTFGEMTLALDIGQRNKTGHLFGSYSNGDTSLAEMEVAVSTISPRLLWKTKLAGMDNRLTIGADWGDWSYTNKTVATGWLSNLDEVGNQHNRAIYFRNELVIGTGTRLSLGARRENVTQDDEDSLTPRIKESVKHNLSAHEFALQQELGAGFSAYGRIGKSFRVATIDENRCQFAPCAPLLKPQQSKDRELGMQWGANGASFRAGLFEMDIDNEIHYEPYGGSNANLPPTRHRGIEFEGKLPIGKTVDLAASYTRIQARFREGTYTSFMGFTADIAGKDVPLVPKDRAGLNLGWQAAAATRVTASVSYVGSQRFDNDQANSFQSMPSYTVADIKVSHSLGFWRFAAGVNNLFDKAYYSYGATNVSATPSRFNAYPEDRRNGYVSAEYKF